MAPKTVQELMGMLSSAFIPNNALLRFIFYL